MTYDISVVVPFYNEEANVAPLIEEITAHMPAGVIYEIIAVDDGSKDNTYITLIALRATYPQLRVVKHIRNFGQSAAQLTGVQHAVYPWVITLDGDGQNMPQDLHIFIETLLQLAPSSQGLLINGNRKASRKDNWLRKFSSFVANLYRQIFLRDKCPDSACCYRLFDKKTFLEMPHFKHFHRYVAALFIRQGATVKFIPIGHRQRERGTSSYGVFNRVFVGIIDVFGMMWLNRRPCNPKVENFTAKHLS